MLINWLARVEGDKSFRRCSLSREKGRKEGRKKTNKKEFRQEKEEALSSWLRPEFRCHRDRSFAGHKAHKWLQQVKGAGLHNKLSSRMCVLVFPNGGTAKQLILLLARSTLVRLSKYKETKQKEKASVSLPLPLLLSGQIICCTSCAN